jgi:hypothetical protein
LYGILKSIRINVKNYPAYYGVTPDFLKKGLWSINKSNIALDWCNKNCQDKYKDSDLYPWAFLNEEDAKKFSIKFGGDVRYKPEEWK